MQNFTEIVPIVVAAANDHSAAISSILVASAFATAIAVLAGMAPGISQGLAAGKAAESVARQPGAAADIRSTLIVGSVLTETSGIYGLLIALLLIFANPFVNLYVNAIERLTGL